MSGRPHARRQQTSVNGSGQYRTDHTLGFTTHWEGVLNLSDPTSPLVWTRVQDESAASSTDITNMQPSLLPHRGPHMRPFTLPYTDCSAGSGSGGVRMWHGDNNVGDCIRFTGTGSQPLASINYPASPYPVSSSLSMGTVGSSGHGYLNCAGGNWNFYGGTTYQHLLASSGSANCDGNHNYVYTIFSEYTFSLADRDAYGRLLCSGCHR